MLIVGEKHEPSSSSKATLVVGASKNIVVEIEGRTMYLPVFG